MDKTTRKTRAIAGLAAIAAGAIAAVIPMVRADAITTTTPSRISGSDRYGTAAAISAATFPANVPVAYVASGADFPDALAAASPAALAHGPVLLTQPSSLPSATVSELQRLKPAKIIVLGGTSSVAQSVQAGLQQYTASNTVAAVTRIAGADRYATAAAISAASFPGPVTNVYVASGEGFADALAGGPAAANDPAGSGPLLLVHAGSIPDATKTELQRLGTSLKLVVLGGTSTVNDSVFLALKAYTNVTSVVRRSGADRYLTAVAISSAAFPTTAPNVYLATGATFPDALAGGPAAGFVHGPVLLTQANCIPPAVNAEITRLSPSKLIILGGTSSVSDLVMARTPCASPTTTTTGAGTTTVPTVPSGGFNPCSLGTVPTVPGFPNPCP